MQKEHTKIIASFTIVGLLVVVGAFPLLAKIGIRNVTDQQAAALLQGVDKRDIDKDGIVDGYDAYLVNRQNAGTLSSAIAFPIRTMVLNTLGNSLESVEPVDAGLVEYGGGGFTIRGYRTKYEKKGHARFTCEPPMLNITFDKLDSQGRPRQLFNAATTFPGYAELQYQEVRFVGDCDLNRDYFASEGSYGLNGNVDIQLLDYIVYKILRSFGVPAVDPVAFVNLSFITPDPRYGNKSYPYMVLQRDNEQDDQIPFTTQFRLEPSLIEDGQLNRWYGIWNPDDNRLRSVTYKDVVNNRDQTIQLNSDSQIRYLLFSDFLQIGDRGPLHNEDYGHEIGADTWKTIPYGFDFGFYGCRAGSPKGNYLSSEVSRLPSDIRPQYQASYYRIAREIFGSEENLYKMLLAVDQFPFKVDKSVLKKYLRLAFYQYSTYYSSEEFAKDMHQTYTPLRVVLPFRSDIEVQKAESDLSASCKGTYESAPPFGISIAPNPDLVLSGDFVNENQVSARANYTVDITAQTNNLHISKSNFFKFTVSDSENNNNYAGYAYASYRKPENLIDEPGPYYILPTGRTAHFDIIAYGYIPNKDGAYHVSLTKVWLGSRYGFVNVPENRTNSVSVQSNKPTISLSSPNGGEQFNLSSFIPMRWSSRNLSGTTSLDVYLSRGQNSRDEAVGPVAHVKNSESDTFSFPLGSIPAGSYYLHIACNPDSDCEGDVSDQPITVVAPLRPITVSDSTLNLEYDPTGGEASLVADLTLKIGEGSENLRISKWGFQIGALGTTGRYANYSPTLSITTSGAIIETSEEYVVSADRAGTFNIKARFNPRQMFAGEYYATLSSISYITSDRDQSLVEVIEVPANRTNTKVIIGEISPFITRIIPNPITLNQQGPFPIVTISGVRFSRTRNIVTVGNRVFDKPSLDGNAITFDPHAEGVLIGSQVLSVTDPVTGASNQVHFNITTTDQVGIHYVGVSSRSLNVGDTLALELIAVNETNQPLSNILISAKDQNGWGGEATVNFESQDKRSIPFTFPVTQAQAGNNPHRFSIKINSVEVTSETVTVSGGGQVRTAYYYCKSLVRTVPENASARRYYYECSENPGFTVNTATARDECIQNDDNQCLFNQARMNFLGTLYCPQGATGFNYVTHRFNCSVPR